ncbi:MAG: hypothetical protein LC679_05090 [Intrasporangiaceae bacterium]|nr:hypothetical protein [Intrasporangiaceae bacterium]
MVYTFDFENGTDGNNILASDAPGIHDVILSGASTAKYETTGAIRGSLSGVISAPGSDIGALSFYGDTGARVDVGTIQFEFRYSVGTAGTELLRLRSTSSNSRAVVFLHLDSDYIILYSQNSATNLYQSANGSLSPETDYLFDFWCHRTNGEAAVRITEVDTGTVVVTSGVQTGDFGGSGWDYYQVGKPTAAGTDADIVFDSVALEDGRASFFPTTSTATYDLTTATNGSGSVTLTPAGGTYDENEVVSVEAVPDAGWSFNAWSGDLTGSTNPDNVTMDANKTVTATFTQDPPAVPANLSAATSPAVGLSWDAVADADSYDLERDSGVITSGLTATEYVDTGIVFDVSYTYRVRTDKGGAKSEWSPPITVTPTLTGALQSEVFVADEESRLWRSVDTSNTLDWPGFVTGDPPVASVTASHATVTTGQTVTFDVSGSTGSGLVVYLDTVVDINDPDATPVGQFPLGYVTGDTLDFEFSNEGDKYIRCIVEDDQGRTDRAYVTVVVSGATASAPTTAPDLSGTVISASRIDWTWTSTDIGHSYEYRVKTGTGTYSAWTDNGTSRTFVDDGHTEGTERTVQVRAYNSEGIGPESAEVTRTTTADAPEPSDPGDFDPNNYPFPILFPTSPDDVGIEGVGLTTADLADTGSSSATVRYKTDGTIRNDYGIISNPGAAGTANDPFIIDKVWHHGTMNFDGGSGSFHITVRRSKFDTSGDRYYGLRAYSGATLNVEDCTIGQMNGGVYEQAAVVSTGYMTIRRTRIFWTNDCVKINQGIIEDSYFTNDISTYDPGISNYTHSDNIQDNASSSMDMIVRRCYLDNSVTRSGGPDDGLQRGGNGNLQQKPEGAGESHKWVFEDCFLFAANNYTLNYENRGFVSSPAWSYTARRCIVEPFPGDTGWVAGGANGIRTGGGGNANYTISDIYRKDGTDVT